MPDHDLHTGITLSDSSFRFRTSRSSGPGGQNVNKLDTRVELIIEVGDILGLTTLQLLKLRADLKHRLDTRDRLHFVSQKFRTQGQNREEVVRIALEELSNALIPEKKRTKTRPRRGAVEKRLEEKRIRSSRKHHRRPPASGGDE